jgi:transposase
VAATALTFDESQSHKPLLLFFQDEGRFGRINTLHRCWVPAGTRAIIGKQLIRQYTYAYTAVCPETGETFSLILPYANSEAMAIFLKGLSNQYSQNRIIMIMDNASWHSVRSLSSVQNIKPLFLPARSPELNPVECIWHYIKEKYFSNRVFNSIIEVEMKLAEALAELNFTKQKMKKMTAFNWISI